MISDVLKNYYLPKYGHSYHFLPRMTAAGPVRRRFSKQAQAPRRVVQVQRNL